MQELDRRLAEQLDEARSLRPGADLSRLAIALIDRLPIGETLDAAWARLPKDTQSLVRAHGHWVAWSDDAARLAECSNATAEMALIDLLRADWVLADSLAFRPSVRAWMRARLVPSAALVQRASALAEEAFHVSRLHDHDMAPADVRDRLTHCAAWSDALPEVFQWAQLGQRALKPESTRVPHACRGLGSRPPEMPTCEDGWPSPSFSS